MSGALHDRTLAIAVGRLRAASAEDQRGSGKIGGRDDFDEFIDADERVVDIGQTRRNHFAQIVRRNVGRHADSDAASAVDQNVREAGRENLRFFAAAIIVRLKIDGILVEII